MGLDLNSEKEQGFVLIRMGENINETIRRVNEEGWDVLQLVALASSTRGLLVQRAWPFKKEN